MMAAGVTDHVWTLQELLMYRVPPRAPENIVSIDEGHQSLAARRKIPPIPPPLSRWAGEGRGSGGGVRAQVPPSTTPRVALKKQNSISPTVNRRADSAKPGGLF